MARGDKGEKIRGASGRCIGRPCLCDKDPGKGSCFKQLRGPNSDLCRNCQSPEVQTERIKTFGR